MVKSRRKKAPRGDQPRAARGGRGTPNCLAEQPNTGGRHYSIRESLHGALSDFARESGLEEIHLIEMIREFVWLLASYREEDSPLFPEVFVFANRRGLTTLTPGGFELPLGRVPLQSASSAAILKACAPLANGGWAVYVVRDGQNADFGLFRSLRHAYAMAAEESMYGLGLDEPVVLVRNRGHQTAELRNGTFRAFTATLTTAPASACALAQYARSFAEAAAARLAPPDRNTFEVYLQRLVTDSLLRCHGALLAVAANPRQNPALSDSVWLAKPVDLAALHAEAVKRRSADALANLTAAEVLFRGAMQSDGLALLTNDGKLLAFRVFLKPSTSEARVSGNGGGRRRAYEMMKRRLGRHFDAVLFRSQDGEVLFERKAK